MKEEKVFFRNSKGQKLVGIISKPDAKGKFPAVVYVHGFGGRGKNSPKLTHIAKLLTKKDFVFFRFDLNGIGESEGDFFDASITSYVDDVKTAVEFIEKQDYADENNISLYGSSMGVLVSVAYYSENNKIKSMVLVAGESKFSWHKRHLNEKELRKYKDRGYYTRKSKTTGKVKKLGWSWVEDGLKYNFNRLYSEIKCPVLVVHGDKDSCVPYENMAGIMNLLNTKKEAYTLKNADHWFTDNEVKEFADVIVKFLSRHTRGEP